MLAAAVRTFAFPHFTSTNPSLRVGLLVPNWAAATNYLLKRLAGADPLWRLPVLSHAKLLQANNSFAADDTGAVRLER